MRTPSPLPIASIVAPRGPLLRVMAVLALVAMATAGVGMNVATAASLMSGGAEERAEDLGGKWDARTMLARRVSLNLAKDSSARIMTLAVRRRSAAACTPRVRPLLLPTHLIGAGVSMRC